MDVEIGKDIHTPLVENGNPMHPRKSTINQLSATALDEKPQNGNRECDTKVRRGMYIYLFFYPSLIFVYMANDILGTEQYTSSHRFTMQRAEGHRARFIISAYQKVIR